MSSTCKSLKVFDFSEEDELPDIASAKFSCKFKSANAVDKYNFLEEVACGVNVQSKKIDDLQHVDDDATDNDRNGDNTDSPLDMEREDCATKGISGLDDDLQFSSVDHEDHPQFISNRLEPGSISALSEVRASSPRTASPGNSQLNCAVLESLSSDESVDVVSDSVENMNENSSSTQSDVAEDGVCMDGALSDPCIGSCKMDNGNMAVAICPEYVIYRDKYCTESVLVFSGSCINMKGSTAYGNQGTFKFHWGLDDIIEIESQFFRRVETAIVKLRVMSKREVQAESLHDTSSIEELKFAIVDSDWYKKQDEIVSLDLRYKALWNVVFDAEMGKDGEALIGQNGVHIPGCYFPNFDEPFEEVVYPKGDADAVCISKRDVDLLQPDTFVNDTIIDFYIKYLKNQIKPDERHRFHFFNSFFFRKLADLDKDPSSAFDGRAAFQRVRKWTRKVNLFEKDYIFIPINFNFHWSLIVVCHPGEVAAFQDEDVVKSLKVPCILHMDSIKGSHTGLKDLVQSYLWEEWKERQKDACEDMSPKFFNLRFVPLELPQQQNSFDCGLFLLHYVELFLDEAPVNFSPFKITKLSNFLTVDWFPPAEASLKRVLIQRLIYELLENHPQEISLENHADKHCTSNHRRSNNDNETGVEFLSESCSPLKSCPGNLLTSRASQGIEMTLLPTSYLRNTQCASDSGLVLREFFEPGDTAGSFLVGQQYQAFDQPASFNEFKSAMSIEGAVEPGDHDHFAYSPSTGTGFQRLAEITPESCSFPYSSRDFGAETSWHPGISMPPAGHEDIDSSPETSLCVSDDNSFEVEANRDSIDGHAASVEEKIDQPSPPLRENIDCLTESQPAAPSEMVDGNGDACPLTSCPNTLTGLSHEDFDETQQNKDVTSDDVRLIDDDSDSDMQQVAKKLRLTPSPEEERKITRNLSGDLQL